MIESYRARKLRLSYNKRRERAQRLQPRVVFVPKSTMTLDPVGNVQAVRDGRVQRNFLQQP